MTEPLKYGLLIFCFLWTESCFAQTYSSLIEDKEIYSFLNWLTKSEKRPYGEPKLKRKEIYYEISKWDSASFIVKDTALQAKYPFFDLDMRYIYKHSLGVDTLLNRQDRSFLFEQFSAIRDTVWHTPFNHSKLLLNRNQKRPNRHYYSVPLFSVDRKYVIVNSAYVCGGLCAYMGIYLYQRIGTDEWKYLLTIHSVTAWLISRGSRIRIFKDILLKKKLKRKQNIFYSIFTLTKVPWHTCKTLTEVEEMLSFCLASALLKMTSLSAVPFAQMITDAAF